MDLHIILFEFLEYWSFEQFNCSSYLFVVYILETEQLNFDWGVSLFHGVNPSDTTHAHSFILQEQFRALHSIWLFWLYNAAYVQIIILSQSIFRLEEIAFSTMIKQIVIEHVNGGWSDFYGSHPPGLVLSKLSCSLPMSFSKSGYIILATNCALLNINFSLRYRLFIIIIEFSRRRKISSWRV